MKKLVAILLAVALLSLTAFCSAESTQTEVTLYADFSCGSEVAQENGLISTETATVSELTPQALAEALSLWTGLGFTLNAASVEETAITVDWAADSTLVAGLDDREQKEDFFFYDQDSLRWFMMDSLYQTLLANFSVGEVYYTMDGGQELSFDELYPVSVFPADISYLGSPFYFAHAGGQGEGDEAADFSRTEGTWVLSGEGGDLLTLMLDGQGYFTAIHRDGQEISGYLEYVDEYGDGNGRYDMYDSEGTFLQGFTFDSHDQIHVGNDEGTEYVRIDAEEEEASIPIGVFVCTPGFTGLTPVVTDNDFHGGYYYSDMMENAVTMIVNCGIPSGLVSYERDELIAQFIELICDSEYRDLTIQEETFGSYPAYRLSWLRGQNEDTRQWDALLVCTDAYLYIYAFNTAVDYAEEMADTWQETLDGLDLVFPEGE